jgi:hypothetical protein
MKKIADGAVLLYVIISKKVMKIKIKKVYRKLLNSF